MTVYMCRVQGPGTYKPLQPDTLGWHERGRRQRTGIGAFCAGHAAQAKRLGLSWVLSAFASGRRKHLASVIASCAMTVFSASCVYAKPCCPQCREVRM